jgi:hypothetical protein
MLRLSRHVFSIPLVLVVFSALGCGDNGTEPKPSASTALKCVWSQRFGDGSRQQARAAVIDASGSTVITGTFAGTVDFGGGDLMSAGQEDVFIEQFSR